MEIRLKNTLPNILKSKGITINELCARLNITRVTYYQYINRNVTIDTICKISECLNIDINVLLGIDLSQKSENKGNNSVICPHCNKPIKLHIQAKK